ncbi:MAG: hypothetical protein AMXMBFR13_39870 [Phycisphaerae bacterium]
MRSWTPARVFSCGFFLLASAAPRQAIAQCGAWSEPLNLSQDAGHFAVDASLAVDGTGGVHLVYQSFLDSSGANFYMTNAGGGWSAPQPLGNMNGKGSTPQIVITPDQQLHVFYGRNTLYYRSKPVVGGSWSAPVQITQNPGSGFIEGLTVDSDGGIYFLYGNLFDNSAPARNGIYGRYKPLGGAWQATELIYGNSDDGNWPRGEQVIARGTTLWVSIGVDGNMYYKKKPSPGTWPGGKGTRFNEDGGGLRFAMDPNSSEIAALWGVSLPCSGPCEDDPWFEAYVKYSHDDGASWSGTFNVSDMLNDIDRTPAGVYDAEGNLHVVWEGFCCDHKLRMRYRGRIRGVWGPIQRLSQHVGGYVPNNSLKAWGAGLFLGFSDGQTGVGLYDVVFTSYTPTGPRMQIGPQELSRPHWIGRALTADTLTLANSCPGALNYAISDDADWLEVTPDAGSVGGEADTLEVSYPGAAELAAGVHSAVITVSGNASNSPQALTVTVTVQTVAPDADEDGDVDLSDFGAFQTCLTGPSHAQLDPDCQWARLDGDSDVDQDDFGLFQGCLSGPNILAETDCMP